MTWFETVFVIALLVADEMSVPYQSVLHIFNSADTFLRGNGDEPRNHLESGNSTSSGLLSLSTQSHFAICYTSKMSAFDSLFKVCGVSRFAGQETPDIWRESANKLRRNPRYLPKNGSQNLQLRVQVRHIRCLLLVKLFSNSY